MVEAAVEKFNPFAGLMGHGAVADLLRREASAPGHAYLFVGPDGVGKAFVARAFAGLILCPQSGDHEEACRSCRRIRSGNHPDLVMVVPEGRASLGVDQARSMISQASLVPVESDRRVFLIGEAEMMTEQAANALLKTLEEPNPSTVFILVAESEDDFPPTVASRCRRVHFGRMMEDELVAALEDRGLEQAEARVVALVAGGRPGFALSLATRPEVADLRKAWLAVPERVTGRPGEAFMLAEEILALLEPVAIGIAGDQPTTESKDRAKRRALQSLLSSGLEILASWYADAASLQLGGPIRNRDVPLPSLTQITPGRAVENAGRVLDAVVDLAGNLRPLPLLASLFTSLGSES